MTDVLDEPTRRLVDAVVAVSGETNLPLVLHRLTELACEITGAKYGALGVIGAEGSLAEFVHVGIRPEDAIRIGDLPKGNGILGLLIVDPRPLRLPKIGSHPESFGFPPNHPPMDSFLGVPIRVRGEVFGNLYLTQKQGADEFTEADEHRILVLATAAGAAIENARRHGLTRSVAVLEDRERIARDLHDTVIQRLFAAGMGLEGLLRRVNDPLVSERIQRTVDELDETIREIRSVIFAVESAKRKGSGLRSDLLGVVGDAAPALGFEPTVMFEGAVDALVPEGIADHLLAVTREALSNVARHARATTVRVQLTVTEDIVLEVIDDGRGPFSSGRRGNGLRNMADRAKALGGIAHLEARTDGGSRLEWRIPLHRQAGAES